MGKTYTDRNPRSVAALNARYVQAYGVSAEALIAPFFDPISRSARVLEVGANIGVQLMLLEKMGFTRLYGLDVQHYAAHKAPVRFPYTQGSILNLPYLDEAFDVVFTSGVLIHIAPHNLPQAMAEMHRVARCYIWGHEYYAPTIQAVSWRGQQSALWKGDYANMFFAQFQNIQFLDRRELHYLGSENVDCMYFLEKSSWLDSH